MNKPRLRQFLALFLVLCMLCSTTLPIYAESSTREVVPVETAVSVAICTMRTRRRTTRIADGGSPIKVNS